MNNSRANVNLSLNSNSGNSNSLTHNSLTNGLTPASNSNAGGIWGSSKKSQTASKGTKDLQIEIPGEILN